MFVDRQRLLFLGALLVVTGCTGSQPAFDPANTEVVQTINGMYYSVPKGTTHTREAVTPKVINFYQKIGVRHCRVGDITWEEAKTSEQINQILRGGTKEEGIALYKRAAKEGKIGCASPLKK